MAPSRSPWTAASSISPMISRSTQSTAARVANGAPGKCGPHRYSHWCRASTPRVPALACPATQWRPAPDPGCLRHHRVGLCAVRTPGFAQGRRASWARPRAPRWRWASRPRAAPATSARSPAPRSRRCWAVGVAGPNPAPATGATVIAATTNGGDDVEGTGGCRWKHPAAERGVLSHGDRVHGRRLQRGVAAGERRRHHDEGRRRDLEPRSPRRRTRSPS